ncbi:biotin--[acetyl-CoA-carboxylase] ligase [Roseomonas sp. SSH11]|uniref:biotin--[biotin carboxyl-carrier protein] ligase n=1 Tax=Pararoseomonas baculiformis TaxID=2820812 RepID=A0ABS4AF71_9PROT|nr:biotin--[acetyl-CoA-carboxylase] ligase [Pararoseomonas baculiformis]
MTGVPAGWRLHIHDELPSTADVIRAAGEGGEAERLAVLARRQSAGRGTQGRSWVSPEGNLYLSLLLRPECLARDVPQWGLLAAVAVHEALQAHAGPGLSLKWPNDLLLGGAKCAGILTEAGIGGDGRLSWLSLGIGVNLLHAPAVPGRPTAALPPPPVRPEQAAARIMASLDRWRAIWLREGFEPVRLAWLAHGHAPGHPIAVSGARGILEGQFAGLDERGGLRLRTATGMETLMAGEVSF